jgi:DNA-binding winged helix-turn-helix (wHTH) protein
MLRAVTATRHTRCAPAFVTPRSKMARSLETCKATRTLKRPSYYVWIAFCGFGPRLSALRWKRDSFRAEDFAVLRFHVENHGRLVSRTSSLPQSCPETVVTDNAMVQNSGELRQALTGKKPRLIRTVPRRGYQFEAGVARATVVPVEPAPVSAVSSDVAPDPTVVRKPVTCVWSLRPACVPGGDSLLFPFAALVAVGVLWSGVATR